MGSSSAIIGQGAFGSAMHSVLSDAGHHVSLFGREFPAALAQDYIFLAVPTIAIQSVLSRLDISHNQVVVFCNKGLLTNGEVTSTLLPPAQSYAVLAGPGFAQELMQNLPAIHAVAATAPLAQRMAESFSGPNFRLYWSDDPIGTQACGALKNILAIAAGILEGLSMGENARAALVLRGAQELRRALLAYGGQEKTLWSPAGLGDLILTCTSPKSRNFCFGQKLAQGQSVDDAIAELGTVEGVQALYGLIKKVPKHDIPIAAMLHSYLLGQVPLPQAMAQLMNRPIQEA